MEPSSFASFGGQVNEFCHIQGGNVLPRRMGHISPWREDVVVQQCILFLAIVPAQSAG